MEVCSTVRPAAAPVPSIDGARCVHALVEVASCRACVDACPHQAWQLDDDRLGLDADACDGCGLCAAVCPQGAIGRPGEPVRVDTEDGLRAYAACDEVVERPHPGVIGCVHSIGLAELTTLYSEGVRALVVATGQCAGCPRGTGTTLQRRVEELNRLVASRAQPPLALHTVPSAAWVARTRVGDRPVSRSRRRLLRRLWVEEGDGGTPVSPGSRPTAQGDHRGFVPRLANTTPESLVPWAPRIDARRCEGCDACARVCPHGAISVHREGDLHGYLSTPQRCTGCGICRDICTAHAVELIPQAPARRRVVRLSEHQCAGCANAFALPLGSPIDSHYCGVCRLGVRQRGLRAVLDAEP